MITSGQTGSSARPPNPFAGARAFCACCDLNASFAAHVSSVGRRRFVAAAAGSGSSAGHAPRSGATLATGTAQTVVYTARKIVTMDDDVPTATAIAVSEGRIIAVGAFDEIRQSLGAQPFTVDERLADKFVLPGLIEQHLHPILSALFLTSEIIANDEWVLGDRRVPSASSPEAYRARLVAAVHAHDSNESFFYSWGYHPYWHGALTRSELDAISNEKPIAVWHRSCHEFFLNTPALESLGISQEATRGHGLASTQADWVKGHFYEKGLDILMPELMPRFASPERMVAGLNALKTYLHRAGVTALNEPGAQVNPQLLGLYQAVLGADDVPFLTTLIVDGRAMFDRHREAGALAATEKTIALAPAGKVRFFPGQIKFYADGAIVSQKMQMKDGYLDGHKGEWMTEPDDFRAAFKLYWEAGYQPHIHVNGDLGLDMVLDSLEVCLKVSPRNNHRTVIVHFANSTEEQVARIARLGAVVSANPYYVPAFADAYGSWGLGRERADNMTRLGSCVRAGVSVSLHSDMPIGPAQPLFNAWAAVMRRTVSGRVAGPEHRLTVEQALRAVTIDAAYSWRMDHELGSVTVGKIANLTILDNDPLSSDPVHLKDVPVWGTMFEGRLAPLGLSFQ